MKRWLLPLTLLSIALAPVASDPVASYAWPGWARTARIAGAFFELEDSEAEIDARLDALAVQNVSVALADSPWGWSYSAWVDDAEFHAVRDLVTMMVQKARACGLRAVMHVTALELISNPECNPGLEHPDWPPRRPVALRRSMQRGRLSRWHCSDPKGFGNP